MPATTSASISSKAPLAVSADAAQGECLDADERLVIAPGAGVFTPAVDLSAGASIDAGQVVGHLHAGQSATPVVSPFAGRAGEALAWHGERLVAHQPVMWLRLDNPGA